MPRRRLQLLWRCIVAAYLLALGVIVGAQVAGEQTELLRAAVVGVLVHGGRRDVGPGLGPVDDVDDARRDELPWSAGWAR